MGTKIGIFLIVATAIVFFSCEKDNRQVSSIPNIRVNFSVNTLSIPELQTPLTPKYIQIANGQKVGYKGHGVYVVKINGNEFRAFDASCTYSGSEENHSEIREHLLQKNTNPMLVYCTKCHSVFNLFDGNVQEGKAKEALKEYKTTVSGNTVSVHN